MIQFKNKQRTNEKYILSNTPEANYSAAPCCRGYQIFLGTKYQNGEKYTN
jgi:hypothetical protein